MAYNTYLEDEDYNYLQWLKNHIHKRHVDGDKEQVDFWLDILSKHLDYLHGISKKRKIYNEQLTTHE